jgi:hypothetical protein
MPAPRATQDRPLLLGSVSAALTRWANSRWSVSSEWTTVAESLRTDGVACATAFAGIADPDNGAGGLVSQRRQGSMARAMLHVVPRVSRG